MNGDGLPDRVSADTGSPYQEFKVQLNTGGGFTRGSLWQPLNSQGQTSAAWNSLAAQPSGGDYSVMLVDINGDGLPDRVMRSVNTPYTNFVVEFNNGAGFEPDTNWGAVDTQGNNANTTWGSPLGNNSGSTYATLIDVNGDGLPDRVMEVDSSPYTYWLVQLNTGHGFAPSVVWSGVDGQSQPGNPNWNAITFRNNSGENTVVDFFDINGDGLPDRVMMVDNAPYTNFCGSIKPGSVSRSALWCKQRHRGQYASQLRRLYNFK